MWYSQYYTFQVQYRVRRRLSPAKASTVYGSSGEQWEDWSAWQWCDVPAGETAGDTVRTDTVHTNMGFSYTAQEFGFPWDFSEYDAIEYEARVRVYNEPDSTYSEWQTATLRVSYEPSISVTAEQTDTGLTVTVITDWQRGGVVKLYAGQDLGDHFVETRLTQTVTGESAGELDSKGAYSGNVTVDIPAGAVSYLRDTSTTLKISGNSVFKPHDGSSFVFSQQGIESIPIGEYSGTIDQPQVELIDDDVVQVANSEIYTNVFMAASWEDNEGNAYASEVTVAKSAIDGMWHGTLDCAPYDSEITLRCAGVNANRWAQSIMELGIGSHSRFTITNGAGSASIVLLDTDSPLSLDEDLALETDKPLGANRPHSAYSDGGERSISLSGVVLRGDLESAYSQTTHKNLLAVLRHKGDSWLRTPGGGRFRVAVKSFSLSARSKFETVSIEMEEVE